MYVTLIDSPALAALAGQNNCKIFDCRFSLADTRWGEHAYAEGHIPNAAYLHLDRDLSSPIAPDSGRHPLPDKNKFSSTLAALGVNHTTQVIVYDDARISTPTAARAWWLLRWLGHEAVAVLDGGLSAWLEHGGALEQSNTTASAGNFCAHPQNNALLSTQQLAQQLAQQLTEQPAQSRWQLVDARAPERFRGEVEPLDTVAGHIPSAINRPLTENLQANGRFKPAEQLRAEWETLLAGRLASDIVHMCGSGVTACHNLLAMEQAGLSGSRLYAGSWSEWIRDSARPIATG